MSESSWWNEWREAEGEWVEVSGRSVCKREGGRGIYRLDVLEGVSRSRYSVQLTFK